MNMSNLQVPFNDLKPLHQMLKPSLEKAFHRVYDSGIFILGPELKQLEQDLAHFNHYSYAVGVANGTDALELALKSYRFLTRFEIPKSKMYVITVANSAPATVCAIIRAGFTPRFVEVDKMGQMDWRELENVSWQDVFAVVPVLLYGDSPNLDKIVEMARLHGVYVIGDGAQAYGALPDNLDALALSFYPTKNLGALGDGGAILTNLRLHTTVVKAMRFYGIYESDRANLYQTMMGQNSRLDEMQAAFLNEKLKYYHYYEQDRLESVNIYYRLLSPLDIIPWAMGGNPGRHIVNVLVPDRDRIRKHLKANGIDTAVHYPVPAHEQGPTEQLIDLPKTEAWCKQTLSLPLYFGIGAERIEYVCKVLNEAL